MYRYMQKRYKYAFFKMYHTKFPYSIDMYMCTHITLQTSRVDEVLVDEVLVQTALSHLTQKLKPK